MAWIFFVRIFLQGFLRGVFVKIFARIYWEEAPKFHQENLLKFNMLWGPCGEGLGRQEGEVETLASLTKARISKNWGVERAPMEK